MCTTYGNFAILLYLMQHATGYLLTPKMDFLHFFGNKQPITSKNKDVTNTILTLPDAKRCLILSCLPYCFRKRILILKFFFAHNHVRFGNSVTFKIRVALEVLQYLDRHEPQRFDFCIECTPTDRTCQLYHQQVKIMIIYEGTNNLVSCAFLKCSSIVSLQERRSRSYQVFNFQMRIMT